MERGGIVTPGTFVIENYQQHAMIHHVEIQHYKFDRITLNPDKCFGKPCIRGLRMPIASILGYLGSGMTVEEILRGWPELELEDIYQALGYASWVMQERIIPIQNDVSTG